MKKISLILFVLIIAGNYSCERDDICPAATSTTPRLLINLLDASNQNNMKNVFGLVVIGVENGEPVDIPLPPYVLATANNLILPLKTTDDTTEYILIKEAELNDNGTPDDGSDDFIDGGNTDRIIINYTREQVYVSRACGFKTIFRNVTLNIVDDSDNWMLSRIPLIDNQSIENETAAHFNITH